ncbi:hypothetical protein [Spiroplasma endosymbiont of Crioceris asparagi]|uniref:hypothetical protein n=1 Tax=Spiroplasma endosymbiont of Crioceris asparagi TaxID=3066286 RepID=UPI0030D3A3B9
MFKKIFSLKTLIVLIVIFPSLLGFVMMTPGVGFQSLRFINSVKKQIKKVMPKGKYVLDGKHPMYNAAAGSIIKKTYVADILSVTDWRNPEESGSEANRKKYVEYAEKWYEKTYAEKVKNHQDIDINSVCLDMVKFDEKAVADLFKPTYVKTGIEWFFRDGLEYLFSSKGNDLVKEARLKQTVIDQGQFINALNYSNHTLDGPEVKFSIGNYVVNAKVWLLNIQQESMRAAASLGLLKDHNIKASDIFWNVKPSDLTAPNYVLAIYATFIGYVLFLIIGPISILSYITFLLIVRIRRKYHA